jgi:RND family efflux transporter MFP subunit
MAVQVTNFDSSGSLTGEIQARYDSDLGFHIAGKVVERPVDTGALVTQGQLLARMDNQDQQNALKSAQSALMAAEAVLEQTRTPEERMRKLLTNGYTTQEQYDDAQQQYSTVQAELTAVQANLRTAQDTLC